MGRQGIVFGNREGLLPKRARGYYHEWLREEWLRDEDLPLARAYLDDPVRALRELAPAWQRAEPEMARYFEASRFRGRSDVTAP